MITVHEVTKHYSKRTAVDDVSFNVAAGRVTGFVGPNGAGKSTTMRMMVGLTHPDRGEIRFDGVRYNDLRYRTRVGLANVEAAHGGVDVVGVDHRLADWGDGGAWLCGDGTGDGVGPLRLLQL